MSSKKRRSSRKRNAGRTSRGRKSPTDITVGKKRITNRVQRRIDRGLVKVHKKADIMEECKLIRHRKLRKKKKALKKIVRRQKARARKKK